MMPFMLRVSGQYLSQGVLFSVILAAYSSSKLINNILFLFLIFKVHILVGSLCVTQVLSPTLV